MGIAISPPLPAPSDSATDRGPGQGRLRATVADGIAGHRPGDGPRTGRPGRAAAPHNAEIPPPRGDGIIRVVELRRIELLTSCMPCRRSTN
ncbi:hypothetical protein TPA0598_04_05080 [Streptomyces lydicamycinicus]|uniref:Uncharacterized protein n=1 Tax=Streptomyces lydicamycinicus TaxID=1546107 RepID=A0A0P4R7D5_9ACTN|nr:hypothetical protein TPA0598_04_05080 [Streptomyces lydicamycinicus]